MIRQSGFSLIELMISVTLGSFLILAAAYAFQEAKRTYLINDNVARLQEQAHFVLDILDEDIRHANFWGRHNILSAVSKDASANTAITNDCDDPATSFVGWALDVSNGITGTNNEYPAWGTGCIDTDRYKSDTDTIVVRHADTQTITTLQAGKVYLSSYEKPASVMFITNGTPALPASSEPDSGTYEMRSHGYYVRDHSFSTSDNIPMLRRMTLTDNGTSPIVQDQELSIGVEDFQVEFGVDTSDFESTERGSINRYVAPDNAILNSPAVQILSVRVWLLMRAQNEELNFKNTETYNYGDKTGANVVTVNDGFRRLLVSRTYQVRNMER